MTGIIVLIICFVPILLCILYENLKSPFSYPYFDYQFDVSGKRSPHIEDYLDMFLISGEFEKIWSHQKTIEQWKDNCQYWIEKKHFKKYHRKQYE